MRGVKDFLKPWKELGFIFNDPADKENYVTMCPFSGKADKLVVNKYTGLWNSLNTSNGGNLEQFLHKFFELCLRDTTEKDLHPLATNRQTPTTAFKGHVAINMINNKFMFMMVDPEGKATTLSQCTPGKKLKRLSICKTSMYGTQEVKASKGTIYIVEGEWDWVILKWLLIANGDPSLVVCVPGAHMFKEDYAPLFNGKDVKICFDNDEAGFEGCEKHAKILRPVVRDLQFLVWPSDTEPAYDVRDFITVHAGAPSYKAPTKIQGTYKVFLNLFYPQTKKEKEVPTPEEPKKEDVEIPSVKEVEDVFAKWLEMKTFDPLTVLFGSIFANKLDGDPVWLLLVGPPGDGKTELIMTFNKSPLIETVTTLTPAALISGYRFKEGADPSLLLKINNRILAIKDFTTILSANTYQRDEIFAILRDAYDGYVEKVFGTGIKKSYHSKFGIIAGVTGIIDKYSGNISSLGERFIRFNMGRFMTDEDEDARMEKAVGNINREKGMRDELQNIVWRMVEKSLPKILPRHNPEQKAILRACAKFTAAMRATVVIDKYTQEILVQPFKEVGTRLVKQYTKQAVGMCVYKDKKEVDEEIMRLSIQIAIDTCPILRWKFVERIYKATAGFPGKGMYQQEIEKATHMSSSSVSRTLNELMVLNIVSRIELANPTGFSAAMSYRLIPSIENMMIKMKIPFDKPTPKGKTPTKFTI